ncbi:hypothetical protein SAMN05216360_105124 [Methylobacterium phyllostachyos]|uniref:Uncharacterized protein n=1 Tax=Methylobacterium phyllostachyos TaxID=582672 RepID=A0A1G9Y2U6_9HYPH|nr:hypothetical protein [Methylobacterium phyllostachyos]SDN02765.1 hypothetical protein SAMN05216360_105124 [Methylobacterium phyllostachyos]
MADRLKFPINTRSRHARRAYQVHRFAGSGVVIASRIITARDDTDAQRQAAGLAAGDRAELWASNRLVAVFGAFGHPVATSIRLLADRPTTGS